MAASANKKLLDDMIRQRHYFIGVENGIVRDLVAALSKLDRDLAGQIVQGLGGNDPQAWLTAARQARMFGSLRAILDRAFPQMQKALETAVAEAGRIEANLLYGKLQAQIALLPASFSVFRVPVSFINELVTNYLPADPNAAMKPVVDRLEALKPQTALRVQRAFIEGVARGEGADAVAAKVRAVIGKNSITHRDAAMLARTQLQRVANDVARSFYSRNSDLVSAVQFTATLDKRTCLVCASRDGEVYPVDDSPPLPLHMGCRCFYVPILKSWRELGIKPSQANDDIRRLFDGKPSKKIGYEEWLAGQSAAVQRDILGKTRFEDYAKGKVKLDDFVRDDRVLRIDEYEKKGKR